MTNREAVERLAKMIIPAVFRAEDALQKAKPEWRERVKNIDNDDEMRKLAEEYCTEIATIIVKGGSDYEPDGTLEDEDYKD